MISILLSWLDFLHMIHTQLPTYPHTHTDRQRFPFSQLANPAKFLQSRIGHLDDSRKHHFSYRLDLSPCPNDLMLISCVYHTSYSNVVPFVLLGPWSKFEWDNDQVGYSKMNEWQQEDNSKRGSMSVVWYEVAAWLIICLMMYKNKIWLHTSTKFAAPLPRRARTPLHGPVHIYHTRILIQQCISGEEGKGETGKWMQNVKESILGIGIKRGAAFNTECEVNWYLESLLVRTRYE